MLTRKWFTFTAMALLGGAAVLHADDRERERTVLEFKTMVGVPRPYTGAANAIRGVAGGGLPWTISSGRGKLDASGHLEVDVRGLVLDGNDAAVAQAGRAFQNPIATFAATVSCLSKDTGGAPITVNILTGPFAATTGAASMGGGNAHIEAFVQLPKPCIAPIVFVGSAAGAWFAATGF